LSREDKCRFFLLDNEHINATEIEDANYIKVIKVKVKDDVIAQQIHLNDAQRMQLHAARDART
jgi:hypothetical protein